MISLRSQFVRCTAVLAVLASFVILAGCESSPSRVRDGGDTRNNNTRAMNTAMGEATAGDRLVRLEASAPRQAYANSEFEYRVTVTNTSNMMLHNVELVQYRPQTTTTRRAPANRAGRTGSTDTTDDRDEFNQIGNTYEDTLPDRDRRRRTGGTGDQRASGDDRARGGYRYNAPSQRGDAGSPNTTAVGVLAPGQSKAVTLRNETGDVGMMRMCTGVNYTAALCIATNVINPELALTKRGPQEANVGEDIAYTVTVTNPGRGPARNVVVTDTLPSGLRGESGQELRWEVGALAAGESQDFTIRATPRRTGEFVNRARATADRGLTAETQQTTIVRQAVLEISKTGPQEEYTSLGFDYDITVRNTGDATARNVILTDEVPSGAEFVEANSDGVIQDGSIVWDLGNIAAGEERTVIATLRGSRVGTIRNCATVTSDSAPSATDCATTRFQGVSALLVEVIDQNDPIRIGEREIYTITITNQGDRAASNVAIEAIVSDLAEFVSMRGASSSSTTADGVRSRPISTIAPGESATWTVVVEARRAGDSRFRIRLTADALTRPVVVGESTRIFD